MPGPATSPPKVPQSSRSSITGRQGDILVVSSPKSSPPRHPSKKTASAARLLLNSSAPSSARSAPSHGPPALSSTPREIPCSSPALCPVSLNIGPPPQVPETLRSLPRPIIPKPVGKRFQKLVVTKRPQAMPLTNIQQALQATNTNSSPQLQSTCSPVLRHLEFPAPSPIPQLTSITLPPSLMQRKRVQQWAIILSGLSDDERRSCMLVSRMFRYAGTYMTSCVGPSM